MKKTILLTFLLISVSLCFVGCGSKYPSKNKILSDISEIEAITTDESNSWSVVDIEEIKALKEGHSYETMVKVELNNETYSHAFKTITMEYTYYDKGGWELVNYSDISSVFDATPIKGYSDEKAYSYISQKYKGDVNLEKHETDLSLKQDNFTFSVNNNGLFWNENYTIHLSYYINEESGLWKKNPEQVSNMSKTINTVDKWFYHEEKDWNCSYDDYVFYYLEQFDGNKANIVTVVISKGNKKVQGHNFNMLPSNTIHADNYVCYKKNCNATYDENSKTYSFTSTNSSGYVSLTLSQNALYPSYGDEKTTTFTSKISDVITVPMQVNSWLNKMLFYQSSDSDDLKVTEAEYINNLVGTWRCSSTHRVDTIIITIDGKMNWITQFPNSNVTSGGDEDDYLIYRNESWGKEIDGVWNGIIECLLNPDGSMTTWWLSDDSSAIFTRID